MNKKINPEDISKDIRDNIRILRTQIEKWESGISISDNLPDETITNQNKLHNDIELLQMSAKTEIPTKRDLWLRYK